MNTKTNSKSAKVSACMGGSPSSKVGLDPVGVPLGVVVLRGCAADDNHVLDDCRSGIYHRHDGICIAGKKHSPLLKRRHNSVSSPWAPARYEVVT